MGSINLITKEFLITKEIFLNREGTLERQSEVLTLNSKVPYLKYYFSLKITLRQNRNQKLNYLRTKLKPNLIGLVLNYKRVLNVRGGYKFTLNDNILILELGYSHKISFV